jgi:hypothetical protein
MYHLPLLDALEELWVQKGDMYLPVHDLVKHLSTKHGKNVKKLTAILLYTYVLSSCDTVSYHYGRGKRRPANVDLNMIGCFPNLLQYAGQDTSLEVTKVIFDEVRNFVALYGHNDFNSLDRCREHICL